LAVIVEIRLWSEDKGETWRFKLTDCSGDGHQTELYRSYDATLRHVFEHAYGLVLACRQMDGPDAQLAKTKLTMDAYAATDKLK
jgi:hypothetical protein